MVEHLITDTPNIGHNRKKLNRKKNLSIKDTL